MIYILNGCKEILSLPGILCKALGSCITQCGKMCNDIDCSPLTNCCFEANKCCLNFVDRPLSSMVIITTMLSITQAYYCAMSLQEPSLEDCRMNGAPVDINTWLYVQLGFAFANVLFAMYFQSQVFTKIMEGKTAPTMGEPPLKIEAAHVQEAFKTTFLHDFLVLFYFFILIASFAWSWCGKGWIMQGVGCNPGGYSGWAYYLGLCFFWVTLVYTYCWYSCKCCAGSVEIRGEAAPYAAVHAPAQHGMA